MMRVIATAGLLVVLGATAGVAERNLIPTLDNQPDVCPDQPPEPQWMQDIDVRESHKRLLIQQIYRAQSLQRIVEAQSCECPTRYPSWDSAEGIFVKHFAASEYWDIVEATSEYRRQANELRREAMPICEAAGNW
ncbi:hypothetical protein G5B38_21130 (plasmid) [Pseudohalocynthiibacter aestuariivivens]|jgi:hypothetical protein|uniref:hypothetical protein n=1 Tax=Rhodobacterales TaxID=204455 RepID=UPI0008068322|nr:MULTISPECIES: hypothetical protein [Rhodobacterales]QEE37477.1 hypothetical protein FTO60_17060 [Octadecabacter sp. SW4]QIE48110.1 hypothetical protein G5B38_21130 [Pseudohalocynthiibacter aestuariivivens]GLP88208.1 hypothetical protein GCM10007921_37690 [Tritonibacter mobilis]SDY00437.1 hypothetical protein SAMN05444385_12049 [Tritonibacter mobilis]